MQNENLKNSLNCRTMDVMDIEDLLLEFFSHIKKDV